MPRIDKPKKIKKVNKKVPKLVATKPTPKLTNLPTKTKKIKSSPVDYYNCLMNYAQQGFAEAGKKQKIHSCCKKCKVSAPSLNKQREQELTKLITSYSQVGESLKKLLQPIN